MSISQYCKNNKNDPVFRARSGSVPKSNQFVSDPRLSTKFLETIGPQRLE